MTRVVQVLTQRVGGPVDHAVDVAVELAGRDIDSHVVGPASAGTAAARERGVTWHELEMSGKADVGGAAAVLRRLRALRPDTVHLQDRRAGWLGRGAAGLLGGAGVVYSLHGVADGLSDLVVGNVRAAPRRCRDSWYYLHGERWISRWGGARIVVPSAAVATYALRHVGVPPTMVDVVPNGVDPDRFHPTPHRDRASGEAAGVTALWIGVLAEVKRVPDLLDVADALPGLGLLVVGDGPLRERVEQRVSTTSLRERTRLVGRVADPAPYFGQADLFMLTSAAENCPLALLQAMACGLPVVTTAVGGIPEVVRDGVEGRLCPAGDPAALAAAVGAVAADPTARARMGAAARARVLERYTLAHCVDGLLRSYERAGSGQDGAGRAGSCTS